MYSLFDDETSKIIYESKAENLPKSYSSFLQKLIWLIIQTFYFINQLYIIKIISCPTEC